ncbi:MAG: hypothetical protein V1720_14420 [bacterium]
MQRVKDILFFATLKDGFKCFPHSDEYSHYYDNTPNGWLLDIKKINDAVRYIFVKYGVYTFVEDGRSGGCFGIVIDFNGYIFNDISILKNEIFEKEILGRMINQKEFITELSSNQIGFVTYNTSEIKYYLDKWNNIIKNGIEKNFYKYLEKLNPDIPNYQGYIAFHPDDLQENINDVFIRNGGVSIATKHPRIVMEKNESDVKTIKLESENKIQYIIHLYEKSSNDAIEEKQLRKDVDNSPNESLLSKYQILKDENHNLRLNNESMVDKIHLLEIKIKGLEERISKLTEVKEIPQKRVNEIKQRDKKSFNTYSIKILLAKFKKLSKIYYVIIVMIVFFIAFTIYTIDKINVSKLEETNPIDSTEKIPPEKKEHTYINDVQVVEDAFIYSNDNKFGLLKIDEFLDYGIKEGLQMNSVDDFVTHVSEYLMKGSKIIQEYYTSVDQLWNFIKNTNQNSISAISSHINANLKNDSKTVVYDNNSYWEKAIKGNNNNGGLVVIDYSSVQY